MQAGAGGAPRDAVVLGAGPVGLALAAALAREGLAVAIVDRTAVAASDDRRDQQDWDARVYAISPGSAEFLRSIGAWQRLPVERLAAIETMDVRGDASGRIVFTAYELGERALAWIVEHRELMAALTETVRTCERVEVLAPCEPASIAWHAEAAELQLTDGRSIAAALMVGADGVRSWARTQAGIGSEPRPYGQTAVVTNFATEHAHRGCAYQWFLGRQGVLAWLPLPGRRMSIVWSAPEALAGEIAALDHGQLAQRVASAGANALGRIELITAPATFPLSFLKLPSAVAHRFALVGDAAHGVHPLAGQGVNLGFGDAAALAAVLGARGPVSDAGAGILLERYARRRALPVLAMQVVTDGLVRLFDAPSLQGLRNGGMRAVGALSPLRRLLASAPLR
ncbi:MAG TPA: FAD-dependent monooxygenase [Casimicrobiaceae bacterium]|nr:FAD-dependent monooxygenase [Casimicrobiaceae bacterium]